MKRIFWTGIFISILWSSFALAQSPAAILKKATKASGGGKVWRKIAARQAVGTITRTSDGATGKYQTESQQPGFYAESFDLNGFETAAGYNGKSGWRRDSKNGLQTLTGKASLDFQTEAAFRNSQWFNYKQEKAKITPAGQQNINGRVASVLLLTTAKGVAIRLFFEQASGLLVREEIPAGEETQKIFDYSDFRIVNGIKEPFAITATIGAERYEIKLDQITHNPPLAGSNFDFPKISNEPLPDIPNLLREVQVNQDKVDQILENYTYTQTSISREIGKDGALREKESETFQITSYKGFDVRRLTAKNGKPLAPDQQEKANEKVQERIEEIDKKISKQETKKAQQQRSGAPDENGPNVSIAELLRASNLVNPRRERFRNRDVIVFDFEPNPQFNFDNAKSFLKFFGKTAGAIWIDEEDKQVARVTAFLIDNFNVGGGLVAKLKKGASFTLEQTRVGDEIWLPSVADISLSVKVFLVRGIEVNQIIKSSNYEKFNTEINKAVVEDVVKP